MQSIKSASTLGFLSVGVAISITTMVTVPRVQAAFTGPTEHRGLTVDLLAELAPTTLEATIGLSGYTMRMRSVEIAPNGQIAATSHQDRPGIVTVVQGEWTEGQPTGERTFSLKAYGTFPENEGTVH